MRPAGPQTAAAFALLSQRCWQPSLCCDSTTAAGGAPQQHRLRCVRSICSHPVTLTCQASCCCVLCEGGCLKAAAFDCKLPYGKFDGASRSPQWLCSKYASHSHHVIIIYDRASKSAWMVQRSSKASLVERVSGRAACTLSTAAGSLNAPDQGYGFTLLLFALLQVHMQACTLGCHSVARPNPSDPAPILPYTSTLRQKVMPGFLQFPASHSAAHVVMLVHASAIGRPAA